MNLQVENVNRRIEEWLEKSVSHTQSMTQQLPERHSDVIMTEYVAHPYEAHNHVEGKLICLVTVYNRGRKRK